MSKTLKMGVVGVGHMGSIHARSLARLPECELVGVFDADADAAREVASRNGTRAFVSPEDLLDEVEAVVVATPTHAHPETVSACLSRGAHVLVEKPLSHDLESSEALVSLARKKGLLLAVGYVERFNPAITGIREFIKSPMYVESMRLAPYNPRGTDVDVITDLMVHDIDITLCHIHEEPAALSCIGVPVLTDRIDMANARIEFPSGRIASLTASRVSMQKMRKIRFFQENTYISVNMLTREAEMVIKREGAILPYFPEIDDSIEPAYAEDRDFVSAVLSGREPEVSGADALRTTRLAYMLLEDATRRMNTAGLITP